MKLGDIDYAPSVHQMLITLTAEDVLAQLTDQLNRRKAQLRGAGDKLTMLQQAINDQV